MLQIQNFEQNLQLARQNLDLINQWCKDESKPPQELLQETLSEFANALEELHVATEELQQQNEELCATRQNLELERQKYQDLFEFAPDGYLVTTKEGVIGKANYAIESMLGVRSNFLIGKPVIVFIAESERPMVRRQITQLLSDKTLGNWKINLQPRQNTPFPVEISIAQQKDAQGNPTGLLWLIRDLRERVLIEQKICDQAALLNVATEGIWVKDLAQKITFWNRGAENIYGWEEKEIINQNFHHIIAPKVMPQILKAEKTVLEKGKWQGEIHTLTKSGQEIVVESHWTLMRDPRGTPKAVLMVDNDITEKKKLEAQYYRAQRLESLGSLAIGIAHDFNNLLTPILGISQLLSLHCSNLDQESLEMLKIVQSNAKRGANLIQQMLSFTRGIEAEQGVISISSLLDEVYQIIRTTFPKFIDISFDLPQNLWQVRGDATLLNQVFMNLCVNAYDAMSNSGTLTISAKNCPIDRTSARTNLEAEPENYVLITISDTGIGIDSSNLERIFDPFFTTKELGKGTGLGLSTTLNIVQKHGGFIEVSSQVGQGTQFQVFLPALESAEVIPLESAEVIPEPPRSMVKGEGELILVVDDEACICQAVEAVLKTYNYQVLTAKDGVEAIELYNQHQQEIAVVLMDMSMPDMDGQTAICMLPAINPQVKIIATSGLSSYQSAITKVPNVKTFLPKPYTPETLISTINQILKTE